MDTTPFVVHALLDYTAEARTLIDSGCLSYGVVSKKFVKRNKLLTMDIEPRPIKGVTGEVEFITQVVRTRMDIDSHTEEGAYFYVIPDHLGYDLILGKPWLVRHDGRLEPKRGRLYLQSTGSRLVDREKRPLSRMDVGQISGTVMQGYIRRQRRTKAKDIEVFAATLHDIQKALAPKKPTDPRTRLPAQYMEYLGLFESGKAEELPPHRGAGIDHEIELVQKDGKEPEVPWGPLYSMSKEELLVLRKTLSELLDKQFIRVSHSSAAAPVLFVRKPGGGLRFCVDYRALNALTKKDRYPLPLIHETLNQIGKAKWFTKLDVSSAFHKIRIAKGQEWMTAFRTRYGLYEWMVTPFGLANAPSTFQKYINWALREYLDECCSAYIDDVLIYTDGTLEQHRADVRKILKKLAEAGLYLDINKCEFECQETKYLGYIIRAGKGVEMDPEKIKAILEWQAPTTVKGVRGFLGFANFYRKFIRAFSDIVRPLTELTHKDTKFHWTEECQQNFDKLKELFSTGPILVAFDPERTTVVETDSSGYCTGGVMSQWDEEGVLRPCAYFSKKNAPAECNYEIYDKELLAVVRSLEEWDSQLRSVDNFEVITDHKNLEYFFQPRKLTERHVRWSLLLSRFNFTLRYRPGKDNERADALSRRDQDMPVSDDDERILSRTIQLLKRPEGVETHIAVMSHIAPTMVTDNPIPTPERTENPPTEQVEDPEVDVDALWSQALQDDVDYEIARISVRQQLRKFPAGFPYKVSIAECELNEQEQLLFRGRKWVPKSEPLRTALMDRAHSTLLMGHPGRNETYGAIYRSYFWPNLSQDVRRFVHNCNVCGRTKAWRERKQGLLKPLPIPDRCWQELSMDFIVDLPPSEGCTNIMVITDRLSKGVIFVPLATISTEAVAWAFIQHVVRHHSLPKAIVSDRGSQFVGGMWKRICQLLQIRRRLSTAWHPQTDGATERVNSVLETYLRTYVCYDQSDWVKFLAMGEIAINCRTATATGITPFFFSHGYDPSPYEELIDGDDRPEGAISRLSPIQQGEEVVRRLQEATKWAQASIAFAQQLAEEQANRTRNAAPSYRQGDKVWLKLKNVRTDRPSKKLDWKNAKYTVQEMVGTHSVRLDTPLGIHPVFHVDLLHLASDDPFPSQPSDDQQPPAVLVDGEQEYEVERIVDEKRTKRGRGTKLWYRVKWRGYAKTTWEAADSLSEAVALDEWLVRATD